MSARLYIVDGKWSGFSFNEPKGRGPLEVVVAQNVRDGGDGNLLIGGWRTVERFPSAKFNDACARAVQINTEENVPVEVVKRKGRKIVMLARIDEVD